MAENELPAPPPPALFDLDPELLLAALERLSAKEQAELIDIIVKGKAQSIAVHIKKSPPENLDINARVPAGVHVGLTPLHCAVKHTLPSESTYAISAASDSSSFPCRTARIVEGGGASYNRGRVVDAARADAEAARARGVVDLTRAGELRWAQDADRVALFLPVSEDTKARSIDVDVTPRALSLAVDGAQILERAPLRHGVDGEGSSWTLEDVASRCLVLELPKLDDAIVWASLLDGRSREEIEDELAMQFGREMEE